MFFLAILCFIKNKDKNKKEIKNYFLLFFYLMSILYLILIIVVLSILGVLGFFVYKEQNKKVLNKSLNFALYKIKIIRREIDPDKDQKQEEEKWINLMKQFFSNLANILSMEKPGIFQVSPWTIFEIAKIKEEIFFFVAIDKKMAGFLEKQIYSLFPESEIVLMERDYNIFALDEYVSAGYLKLKKNFHLPIRTYKKLEKNPLAVITGVLTKLAESEEAVIQLVINNKSLNLQASGKKLIANLQEGKTFNQSLKQVSLLGQTMSFFSTKGKDSNQSFSEKRVVDQEVLEGVIGKSNKKNFAVNLRIAVSSLDEYRSREIFFNIANSFEQFSAPNLNSFRLIQVKKRNLKNIIFDFSFRLFKKRQTIILDTEELASIFHFPEPFLKVPKIKFLEAKTASPPANLPLEGFLLGYSLYRDEEVKVRIKRNDRMRHLYVIGQTGTGKSTFLENLIIQDIKDGRGVCILDPHGDLIEDLLFQIPSKRIADLVLFEPSNLERVLGLNMLEYNVNFPEQKTFIINELINIFDKLYDLKQTGGPMFEMYTRNALLLLMDDPNEIYTLMEVPKVLSNESFRRYLLDKCKNIVVKDFWEKEAISPKGHASLKEVVPYITSKFNVFIANDYMRPIIGQEKTTLNFSEIMNQGKILLCNLSKGKLGSINSSLLGLILVGKLTLTAFERASVPFEQRKDFYLYLDEFQNFITDTISVILSEARKYCLSLTMAHQFIGQLSEEIQKAVFGNVGSIGAFRVGPEDAEFLEKQFAPVFNKSDLINIDNFNFYIKLSINGEVSRAFNMKYFYHSKDSVDVEKKEQMRKYSFAKYGRPRELIEQEISLRHQK